MGSPYKMETPHRSSSDIISNLPDQVMETILAHLPIRDAIKTSLLSNKWRYKWNFIPTLVFHEQHTSFPTNPKAFLSNKLVNFVNRVLLHHNGSIEKFELYIHSLQGYVIDSWILFLSKNGVKEIVLMFWTRDRYEVHSSFFSFEAICSLYLCRCILKPPPMFKGFSYLKSLNLESVALADEVFESMISSCTALEILTLMHLEGCHRIKISGLNLKRFYFDGEFVDISFIDAPHLSFVSITLNDNVVDKFVRQGGISNLVRVLGCLTALEKLVIHHCFMQFLAMGNLLKRFPVAYDRLKTISLYINFNDMKQSLAMLCLFQSSPNLQELGVEAAIDDAAECVEDFWKAQRSLYCSMNHLCMFLVMGNLPKRLPVSVAYDCLKSISLYINFKDLKQSLVMLCLFQRAPNLQELEMEVGVEDAIEYVEDFWKAQSGLNCFMNHLRVVKISMLGAQPELEFIEFLLANSPVLEILSVDHFSEKKVEESRVLKELMRFRRASAKAEIEYN
ncbi:hypothetical protein HHK36_006896 [Tetracentron sinense]|uniref:F-box domain-containing protein n=1 Tax=Tetracentron sinense TaxID=13715 RepID=A0A834ZLI1_TETSI|nr:hypothetical protein HHK36_006896 [Tetracentron sinense]